MNTQKAKDLRPAFISQLKRKIYKVCSFFGLFSQAKSHVHYAIPPSSGSCSNVFQRLLYRLFCFLKNLFFYTAPRNNSGRPSCTKALDVE